MVAAGKEPTALSAEMPGRRLRQTCGLLGFPSKSRLELNGSAQSWTLVFLMLQTFLREVKSKAQSLQTCVSSYLEAFGLVL